MNTEKLIEDYLPLAESLAHSFNKKTPNSIEYEDLRQAAYIGLIEAAHKHSGEGFGVYAKIRIAGSIKDFLRNMNWGGRNSERKMASLPEDICQTTSDPFIFVLDGLDGVAMNVLFLYYEEGYSQREIGNKLKLTEGRISQIMKTSKHFLKQRLAS
jgi:RNA polymerase sigma factor (sigma-70 family)